jgi:iron complex outermembrane receptor protein
MVGSFDTRDVWARVGHEFNAVAFSIYAGRRETDQSDATVSNDAQTTFDQLCHTHASLAPGPLDQQRNVTDVQATARAGPWKLSLGEFAETSFHVGAGLAQALDPTGINNNRLATATLTYSNAWGPLTITGFVGYAHVLYGGHATLYPPGAFGGLFPEGVLFAVTPTEDRWHAELFGVYQTRSAHKIVVGVGYFTDVMPTWMDQRNFIVQGSLLIPTGMFAPGAGVGAPPVVQRTVEAADYIYAEDAWIFAPDWTLTLGGRLDAYSSFGNQFNPRAALVWDETSHMTWKLVYTTAFETPSVSQTSSNGIVYPLGSQSLSPTRDRAVSLSNTLAFGGWRTDITLFGYRDSELIITVPDPASVNGQAFVNGGTAEGWGLEGSVNYTWPNGIRVGLTADTYTLVRQAENTEGLEVGLAARHHIGAIGTVPLPGGFAITANVLSVGDYYRPPDAVRPPPPAYTLFGLSGTWQSSDNHVSITAGARNLFNSLAIEPTASALGPTPGIPLPGRELFLSLTLRQ